jgi:hypothetical protein
MLPVDPVGWRMRKSSPSQAKPYGDISIVRGDEWKARFLYRSVVSFGFVNFIQFCHIQKQWVLFSSTSFCLSFSLFPSIQNMQEWCDESKRGVKPEAWHHFAFFLNGSCCCGWWCDVTWRDVMWCVIKLDLMPLTFLGLAIVVANLKLLGQIAICSMYLNVLRREARATRDWRPRPWNIQIQMESAVAEFSTSFAKLQLFVSFCQACSSFSTTL